MLMNKFSKKANMENNKTEIIGFRVTKNELDAIKKMANLHGKTISQWCKKIIIKLASKDNTESNLLNLGEKILLEQFVLLRILLTNGLIDRKLTEDKLKRLIKKADEVKAEKASQLVKDFIKDS
jgi:uncharacterized protein (DUF1778 family)